MQARRTAVRAVLGVVVVTFLVSALALVHVAAWSWIRQRWQLETDATAALLAAGDLVIAGVLTMLALRLTPSQAEIEARLLRQQACMALTETMAWPTTLLRVLPLLRLLRRRDDTSGH